MRNEKALKVKDIYSAVQEIAPFELAEKWDNVGLILGKMSADVNNVLLCVDVTSVVIQEAIQKKCQLIISHHPLIFDAISKINDETVKGTQIIDLCENGIAVISAHTNADCAPDGMNDYLANLLGLEEIHTSEGPYLRIGNLPSEATLDEFIAIVKSKLDIDKVTFSGSLTNKVRRCGVFTGSAEIKELITAKNEYDVVVTGEFNYHKGIELLEEGVNSVLCSHFSSELLFTKWIEERLKKALPEINMFCSEIEKNPFQIM